MKRAKAGLISKTVMVVVLNLLWILPIWPVLLAAVRSPADFVTQYFYEIPTRFHLLQNLESAWRESRISLYFGNSVLYGVVGTFVCIVFASLAMFAITKLRPKGGLLIFAFIFAGTVVPFQMYLVPLFRQYHILGLYDTRVGLLLLYSAFTIPYAALLFRAFFATIPHEIYEASVLEGCSDFVIYSRIFMPMSVAAITVVFLYQFNWIWNDLIFGLILTARPKARPVMVGIAGLIGFDVGEGSIPIIMAGTVLVSLPTIVLYATFRKQFLTGMRLRTAGE